MWELIETNTVGGSPADIDLIWDESVYSSIRIECDGIQPATDGVTFRARLGDNDGGTIHATAGDYDGLTRVWEGTGAWSAHSPTDRIDLAVSCSNAANETINAVIEIEAGRSPDTGCAVKARVQYINNSSNQRVNEVKIFLDDAVAAAIDTCRLFFASGNFANVGDIKVYGLRREVA
jgi:hypothetical protein